VNKLKLIGIGLMFTFLIITLWAILVSALIVIGKVMILAWRRV
jgi:hypothetical protein